MRVLCGPMLYLFCCGPDLRCNYPYLKPFCAQMARRSEMGSLLRTAFCWRLVRRWLPL